MQNSYLLIITLVNPGFSDVIMDAAREAGARGGTIINARGTGNKTMEKRYGIVITPDKEMILILVDKKISDKVMEEIYKVAGLSTAGQGICFSLPVNDVVGMKFEN